MQEAEVERRHRSLSAKRRKRRLEKVAKEARQPREHVKQVSNPGYGNNNIPAANAPFVNYEQNDQGIPMQLESMQDNQHLIQQGKRRDARSSSKRKSSRGKEEDGLRRRENSGSRGKEDKLRRRRGDSHRKEDKLRRRDSSRSRRSSSRRESREKSRQSRDESMPRSRSSSRHSSRRESRRHSGSRRESSTRKSTDPSKRVSFASSSSPTPTVVERGDENWRTLPPPQLAKEDQAELAHLRFSIRQRDSALDEALKKILLLEDEIAGFMIQRNDLIQRMNSGWMDSSDIEGGLRAEELKRVEAGSEAVEIKLEKPARLPDGELQSCLRLACGEMDRLRHLAQCYHRAIKESSPNHYNEIPLPDCPVVEVSDDADLAELAQTVQSKSQECVRFFEELAQLKKLTGVQDLKEENNHLMWQLNWFFDLVRHVGDVDWSLVQDYATRRVMMATSNPSPEKSAEVEWLFFLLEKLGMEKEMFMG